VPLCFHFYSCLPPILFGQLKLGKNKTLMVSGIKYSQGFLWKKNAGAKIPLLEACCPRHILALLVPRPGPECRFTLLQPAPCCTTTPVVQLLEHVWAPLGKLGYWYIHHNWNWHLYSASLCVILDKIFLLRYHPPV
jgi:hypothetical protein